MFRLSAFTFITAGVAIFFCLASLTGEPFGASPAQAQPQGTPNPAGTPIPYECPPASYSYTNSTDGKQTVMYECSGSSATGIELPKGDKVVFDGDGNGQCSGCDMNDDNCTCIECPLTKLIVDGAVMFSCNMQQAYMAAYGLDIAAASIESAVATGAPEPIYDRLGGKMQQWAIPVLDNDNNLVGWEFTTIEPIFSVEDDEVVIRSRLREVIGGPEGITIGKK